MKLFRLFLMLAFFQPAVIVAQLVQTCAISDSSDFSKDRLRENLKRFRSNHKDTFCFRRSIEELAGQRSKAGQPYWLDCSVGEGSIFGRQNLTEDPSPTEPFGVIASFYNKRLAELTFTLDAASIEDVLSKLERCYGQGSHVTRSSAGAVESADWINHDVQLSAELVTIPPIAAEKYFIHVGQEAPRGAVRIRIKSAHPLKPDRLPWAKNSIRRMSSLIAHHPWILVLPF